MSLLPEPIAPRSETIERGSALLLTHDAGLVDTVLRLAAAAGIEVERVSDPGAAVARWHDPRAVVVGADAVADVARLHPPRREGVIVAVGGAATEGVLRASLAVGADHVAELPAADTWMLGRLSDLADSWAGSGRAWGFVGGSGGVGASTLAAAVAVVAARSGPTALLDLDPAGTGLDHILGGGVDDGVRWSDLHSAPGRLTARALRDALPRRHGPAVLSFGADAAPVDPAVGREAVTTARRGHDAVIVDLPRWSDPAATSLLPLFDRIVVVCAASVAGVAGARRVMARMPLDERLELVVRSSRRAADVEGVAAALGIASPVVLGCDKGLEERLDLGLGPCHRSRSPLTRAAGSLVQRMGLGS